MQMSTNWALYPWFEEHGVNLVHPEDLERFRRLAPYGKVFVIDGEAEGFAVLRYGRETFRVRPTLLRVVPAPAFACGQKVRERGGARVGVIANVAWHTTRDRPFFHLTVDGKWDKKRLWEEDLVASDEPMN